jgi:site-specific DNA recombinase
MHAQFPRHKASATGIAYARYSTDFQHSIGDQIRTIFEEAIKKGIFIPREYVFFDTAVRGCKERRPGLDPVRDLLRRKAAQVLLVFTTNRLFRTLYKCMKFVQEEVVERGLRCIFVKSIIDTAEGNRWRLPLQIHALVDELGGSAYAENIRAAHEGQFLKKWVVYTIPFGYTGKEIPGPVTRRQRPRREYTIDPITADWVRLIFHWFVHDRLSLTRIIERLNERKAPLGPMSNGEYWTHMAVRYVLTNPCYRGWWAYGKGQNIWQSQKDYTKRVLRDKPLREAQFEDLRLVSDEVWYRAQELLAAMPQRHAGRKPKDGNMAIRPRLLNGLLFCKTHDRPLRVGGNHGHHMYCPECRNLPKARRPLYTYLNRALALQLICKGLAEQIRQDHGLVRDIVAACQKTVLQHNTQGDSRRLEDRKARLEKMDRQIRFILDNPGDTEMDQKESASRLRECRAERATAARDVAELQALARQPRRLPTEAEVIQLVADLEKVLLEAARAEVPENAGTLRQILELVTGGRIEIEQMGKRRAQRGWLRARFQLQLYPVLSQRLDVNLPDNAPEKEIVLDIRESTVAEEHIDQIKELYESDMLVTAIAEKLRIDRHQVADAVQILHKRNGLPPPQDGRSRRATLPQKRLKPPMFHTIADEVKRLYDQDLLIDEIAARVGTTRGTVRAALEHWFKSRGLPMRDGRHRRKDLPRKNRH